MIQLGVTFNGKNSFNDFGLYIEEKHISSPSPKIVKDSVPYFNGSYDMSMIGNGHITYDSRIIVIKFLLVSKDMTDLHDLYSSILEWLLNVKQNQLIFDYMKDYYFMARVEDVPTFDEFVDNGDLTVTFTCNDPFKYVRNNQTITVTTPMSIYNPYIYSSPNIRIYSNGQGNFILDGKTYAINTTTYKDLNYLYLEHGENTISFSGNITKVEITPNFRRL